jgi:thiol-disulfide isomerase/thioredoxin
MVDMNPTRRVPRRVARALPAALSAVALLLLSACGSTETTTGADPTAAPASSATPSTVPSPVAGDEKSDKDEKAKTKEQAEPAVAPGRYVEWADYDADRSAYADSEVVLFFHAPWCPSCRATEESIDADGVPDGLTLVKVDFDSATELRQKYGVTYQHTYVQVDPDGTALKKWTGSVTGADIAAEVA